jgi:hypothetical protein
MGHCFFWVSMEQSLSWSLWSESYTIDFHEEESLRGWKEFWKTDCSIEKKFLSVSA